MTDLWGPAVISAIVAIVTSAVVSLWSLTRNINHKSVIEERQRWRDTLRDLVPELLSAGDKTERERIRNGIVLRMNPNKDIEVTHNVDLFVSEPTPANAEQVVLCFQDKLKRDWERAKIEASAWPFWAEARADRIVDRQERRLIDSRSVGGSRRA